MDLQLQVIHVTHIEVHQNTKSIHCIFARALLRSDLRAFDAPTEPFCEINYGPLLRDVLRARGWRYSCEPCHGVYDKDSDRSTFYIKEFEVP